MNAIYTFFGPVSERGFYIQRKTVLGLHCMNDFRQQGNIIVISQEYRHDTNFWKRITPFSRVLFERLIFFGLITICIHRVIGLNH